MATANKDIPDEIIFIAGIGKIEITIRKSEQSEGYNLFVECAEIDYFSLHYVPSEDMISSIKQEALNDLKEMYHVA